MARNRGRSVDDNEPVDEPVEDAYDDADLDDADLDADFDEDDLEDDLEDEEKEQPARRSRAGATTRERAASVSRSRTKVAAGERGRARAKEGVGGPSILGRLVRRFRETVAELQKVIWPTRKELLTYTTVVVVFVTLVMSLVFGLDTGFARLMFLIFGNPGE